MSKKATDIVAYIGIIGWLISFFAGTKEESKFHLNQGLIIGIISAGVGLLMIIFGFIPLVNLFMVPILGLVQTACLVFMIIGIINASNGEDKELPGIGKARILK